MIIMKELYNVSQCLTYLRPLKGLLRFEVNLSDIQPMGHVTVGDDWFVSLCVTSGKTWSAKGCSGQAAIINLCHQIEPEIIAASATKETTHGTHE